ncbi:MAG: hypothetical protein HUJ16_13045 [Kangiella sp.]|nr:hypothetical protein [Kangiella sp.]
MDTVVKPRYDSS